MMNIKKKNLTPVTSLPKESFQWKVYQSWVLQNKRFREESEKIKWSHSGQAAKLLKTSRRRHKETILFLL